MAADGTGGLPVLFGLNLVVPERMGYFFRLEVLNAGVVLVKGSVIFLMGTGGLYEGLTKLDLMGPLQDLGFDVPLALEELSALTFDVALLTRFPTTTLFGTGLTGADDVLLNTK